MTISDRYDYIEPDAIPETITRKIYVNYGIGKYCNGQIHVEDSQPSKGTDFGQVCLLETEVTFQLPKCRVNITEKMLEYLEQEKKEVLAENHRRLKEVQDKIDALLCIENKSETSQETSEPFTDDDIPF